jgi:outer membrane immunogenic protein
MKRAITLSIGAMALAATTLPSAAADLGARPITKAPVAAPIAAYNWSGCYIGANAGGKWANGDSVLTIGTLPVVDVLGTTTGNNDASFMGGGQIGCQWQSGAFVWGLEGDIDATDINRGVVATAFGPAGFIIPGDSIDFRNRWQASIRGRIGYAWDRFMIYATGGVAFAEVKTTVGLAPVPFAAPTVFFTDSSTRTGGTIGGGFEYGITDSLSLGVEYRYSKFGDNDITGSPLLFAVPVLASTSFSTSEVTARLNWRFNWFGVGPVAGRY